MHFAKLLLPSTAKQSHKTIFCGSKKLKSFDFKIVVLSELLQLATTKQCHITLFRGGQKRIKFGVKNFCMFEVAASGNNKIVRHFFFFSVHWGGTGGQNFEIFQFKTMCCSNNRAAV